LDVQTAHFSTWFKVVGIDIRGYGRFQKVTAAFSLKDMCDDVIGVMQDAGIARAICGGCSVGSGIAILLGLDIPTDSRPCPGRGNTARATATRNVSKVIATIWRTITSSTCAIWSTRNSPPASSEASPQHVREREPRLEGEAIAQCSWRKSTDMTARCRP